MVRFAQRLITAPDTKGQKEAEKGLKGNLNTNNPLGPFWPLLPFQRSCRLEQAKQTQTLRAAQPQISCQKGLDVASIKRLPQMGHTWRISHLGQ